MTSIRTLMVPLVLLAPVAVPLAAQDPPRSLPPASPPPPAPKLLPPPPNAVAQCNDLTFVVAPAEPTACGPRGGVKVRLPGARSVPTPSPVTPTVRAAAPPSPAPSRNDAPPAGATMRCRDGTWLSGTPSPSRCDGNRGLAVILPAPPPLPLRSP